MILKKMTGMTIATGKNYEGGTLGAVRRCSGRLHHIIWQMTDFVMDPINLLTSVIGLWYIIGPSFIFGISLLFVCFYFDQVLNDIREEMSLDRDKISEKKGELTHQAFESIKTIKLYGWDRYFHREIIDLTD